MGCKPSKHLKFENVDTVEDTPEPSNMKYTAAVYRLNLFRIKQKRFKMKNQL